jgi:hypothetical protein
VNLVNSTISSNSAGFDGGGVSNPDPNSPIAVANSIVAGNMAGATGRDFDGFISSDGHNLIGFVDYVIGYLPGDLVDVDPKLGPLQNNGGPTFTHALLPGSPAIDAGATGDAVDAFGAPLTTDQRGVGFLRVLGTAVDIGAFEYGTPQQRITHLITELNSLPIQASLRKVLVGLLNNALVQLASGKTQAACGSLTAFINLVNAQAGHALTASTATGLAAEGQAVQFLLGCSQGVPTSTTGSTGS